MSRIAKSPIIIPDGIDIKINGQTVSVKGEQGELTRIFNKTVEIQYIEKKNLLFFLARSEYADSWIQAGTARSLLNSMVIGVSQGFIKKLQLIGVGYRATINKDTINLSLGLSHLINHKLPNKVKAICPSQTEIILTSIDKQLLGQVAADLRDYCRPEPYKGKGVRYTDEIIHIKETKKGK